MNHPPDNRTLLRTLGIRVPIIQAPMAGVGTPALAAAVSNAGGLATEIAHPVQCSLLSVSRQRNGARR